MAHIETPRHDAGRRHDIILPAEDDGTLPRVRRIDLSDLRFALAKGFEDFRAMPTHVVFLAAIYPIAGLLIAHTVVRMDLLPLLYPIAAGFALVGPFAAIGLYELSRRREAGLDTSWRHALDVVHSPSLGPILLLGALLLLIFAVWIGVADMIYVAAFGHWRPASIVELASTVLSTSAGWWLMIAGNIAGAAFAALVFALSVVAFPMLLDRHVGLSTAMATSLRVVSVNPLTMLAWAIIVAIGLLAGALPLLVGLAVTLPVLGHATWHLYRRAVEPPTGPRRPYEPKPKPVRYAAQFPGSLFGSSKD